MSLQEKFQVILPPQPNEDDGTEWKTFESARSSTDVPGRKMEMPRPQVDNQNPLTRVMSGETDFSKDTNPEAFKEGYTRREMNGSDDQYTGEHVDHFYGEATDEKGKTGFVERNNYLDRL